MQPTDAFQARVLEGRSLADGGDFVAAERHFRALLDEVRGAHAGDHLLAMSSLITLYGRAGRYLEAHLLARQVAQTARKAGPQGDRRQAFALGAICGALSQLHLDQALAPALSDLREVLDRQSEWLPGFELEYHCAAGSLAAAQEDLPLARHHVHAYRRTIEGTEGMEPVFAWALAMAEARLAFVEGKPEEARRVLARLGKDVVTPPFHNLHQLPLAVSIHVALGEREAALRYAGEAIEILESVEEESYLASSRIEYGTELANQLESLGELDLAHRVYGLVAAAVMIRLRQVDECMHGLPELGLSDPESTAVLAGFRRQFLKEQGALLQHVAEVLEARGDRYVRLLLASSAPAGHIAICAWCESVRPSEGHWLPIGHFIPRCGSLQVTHGICPSCAENMHVASA